MGGFCILGGVGWVIVIEVGYQKGTIYSKRLDEWMLHGCISSTGLSTRVGECQVIV
jgi:hypothetical protein